MKPHLLAATAVFSLILLVPGGAFANQLPGDDDTDTFTNSNEFADDYPDYSKDGNWETNETELKQAHSEITNLMITQNDTPLEQYTGPDIPLTMVYIDDDTMVVGFDTMVVGFDTMVVGFDTMVVGFDTMVVGFDTMAAYFDVPIEPEYLQFFLGIDEPVEIKYVEFQPESHSSENRIKQW